jgi:hypothetical protein
MTFKAWLLTTWGKVRETLQPELFALRNELRLAKAECALACDEIERLRNAESNVIAENTVWRNRAESLLDQPQELATLREQVKEARTLAINERHMKRLAEQREANLSESLAQLTRELKAARAKLKKLEARDPAIKEYAEIVRLSKVAKAALKAKA